MSAETTGPTGATETPVPASVMVQLTQLGKAISSEADKAVARHAATSARLTNIEKSVTKALHRLVSYVTASQVIVIAATQADPSWRQAVPAGVGSVIAWFIAEKFD